MSRLGSEVVDAGTGKVTRRYKATSLTKEQTERIRELIRLHEPKLYSKMRGSKFLRLKVIIECRK